jgi:serine protease Do
MDEFVCVRIVQANNLDLSLFQFDFDLTFAVFLMNADRTIYGRFGSRSSRENATADISLAGFRAAMQAALAMHAAHPRDKSVLAGKRGKYKMKRPEQYPSLKRYKPDLDYAGKVVQSCMHCHQIRDAQRDLVRSRKQPIPDVALYPWPMPQTLGLTLDPDQCATIERVAKDSPAASDGFRAGDVIQTLVGQPLISIADVQWVLHHARGKKIPAEILRDGKPKSMTLSLPKNWRRRSDINWRVSTWELRRMGTGGILFEDAGSAARQRLGIAPGEIALRIKHLGQYGSHATAKRAGFRKGDIVVTVDGDNKRRTNIEFIAYAVQKKRPGDRIAITVLRGGKRLQLKLPMQ